MSPKVNQPPKRLNETKTVSVKAHQRLLYCREYYIICKECDRSVARQTYGPCPLYCTKCRPPKSRKTKTSYKKLPRPKLVLADKRA